MKNILFLILISVSAGRLPAQEVEVLSPEFLHITTDKPFYFEEERLIFQIVALSNKSFKIVKRNDVVYADLMNDQGVKIASEKFLWVDGITNGEFKLPYLLDDISNLHLFVYTPSLLNQVEWVTENHHVPVHRIPSNPLETNALEEGAKKLEASVAFYPEESAIYTNLPNQVFYRIINPDKNAKYRLLLKRNGGQDTIRMEDHTVGAFTFTPSPDTSYSFELLEDRTVVWEKPFNPNQEPGFTLEAETDSVRNLEIKIQHTFPVDKKVNFEIRQGELNVFKRTITLNQPQMTVLVPSNPNSETVAYIVTVTDEQGEKLLQRLVFLDGKTDGNLKWINQRNSLPSGSTPNLLFLIESDSVDFSESYLSVKLMDGRVPEVSGAQFSTAGQEFQQHQLRRSGIFLDHLPVEFTTMSRVEKEAWLLTNQGQVSYKRPVLVPDSVQLSPDPYEKGFKITGRITDMETGEPLPYCPLALANTTSFTLFRFAKTNAEGYFKFNNLVFEGENELFLAMQKYYDRDVNIQIDQPVAPHFDLSAARRASFDVNLDDKMLLNEALERSIIDSVYTGTSDVVKVFRDNNFISKIAGFFLDPTETVDPLEYVPFNEMKDVFKEILPSAYLRFKKKKPLIRMVHSSMQLPPNAVVTGLMDVAALIIVDGVPIFNQEEVLKINPAYVTKYELYHGLFTLGSEVYLGLVHIVTNVDYLNNTEIKGLVKFKYRGIAPPSVIAIGPKGEARSPYLSPLGFWITEVKPDENGVIQLPIRLTSVPGEYILTLEAIDPGGSGRVMQWPLQIE